MSDVIIKVEGKVGRIRLDRPKAIHALNREMCAAMLEALADWAKDAAVEAVVIDHAEGRGFCAGGDIRMIAQSGAGDGKAAREFFHTEYQLNHLLFTYKKPVVAFMDGITMGGGVGISAPARYRVATEHTSFAMPETSIGLFPDVGGGWYLARLPGRLGEYVALTGARLDGADCVALGLATHYLTSDKLEAAKRRIISEPGEIGTILNEMGAKPPEAHILRHKADIDQMFAADGLEEIIKTLDSEGSFWAMAQIKSLKAKSPQSMKVSLRLVHEGRRIASFEDEMRREYAIASRIIHTADFIEGVRAVIIDKDNSPRWKPAAPDQVTKAAVDALLAPLPEAEAWQPYKD